VPPVPVLVELAVDVAVEVAVELDVLPPVPSGI
jgi:hypothetical protein